jgi:hypothetical protein
MRLFLLFILTPCLYLNAQAQRTRTTVNPAVIAVAKPDSSAILIADLTKRIEKLEQRIQQDEEKLKSYYFTLSVPLNKMQKGTGDYDYYFEINDSGLNGNSSAVVTAVIKDEDQTVSSIFVKPVYNAGKSRWYLRIVNLGLVNLYPSVLKSCATCGEYPSQNAGIVKYGKTNEDIKVDVRWISYKK